MRKLHPLLLLIGMLTSFAASATQSPGTPQTRESGAFQLFRVRAYQTTSLQTIGTSFSAGLSWSPELKIAPPLTAGAHVGLELQKSFNQSIYPTACWEAFARFTPPAPLWLNRLGLEVSGGYTTWLDRGTFPLAGLGLQWSPGARWWMGIDRIFVSGSSIFIPERRTTELRVGVGIGL